MKTIIADGQPLFRAGLKSVLERMGDVEVAAEFDEGRQAIAFVNTERPDLAIVDTSLGGLDGLSTLRALRECAWPPAVLAVSAHRVWRVVGEALQAGAIGYVLKCDPAEVYMSAVRSAARQTRYLSPSLDRGMTTKLDGDGLASLGPLAVLTGRQREILRMVLLGRTTIEISASLCISRKTVDTHRAHINRKFRCSSPGALIRFAALNGLLEELEPAPLPRFAPVNDQTFQEPLGAA